jgi:hypothetical protein
LKRKVSIDCGTVGYFEVVDVLELYNDIKEDRGEEQATTFFKEGTFKGDEIEDENGNHYVFGYMEGLMQSDRCPSFLYESETDIQQITIEIVEEKELTVKCENCKHCSFDFKDFTSITYRCDKDKQDLTGVEIIKDVEVECDDFKSKFIEYPLTISGLEKSKDKGLRQSYRGEAGTLVKIRPCAEEYSNKTYLGLLLGDIDVGIMVSHYESTNMLHINRHYNPAIFVPELRKVIYGMESWWGVIKTEEELRQISNEDIDNVWYVQLLKNFDASKEENPVG